MVLFNYSTKELTAKIVYYGPGLCGKTTNLQFIHESLPDEKRGRMLSLSTQTDRTLYFDFLPMELGEIRGMKTRIQLYTVPGQVFYNETRKMVLKGVDGMVFVADSQTQMADANIESFRNLLTNLKEHGLDAAKLPLVLQFNKRDLPTIQSVEEMNSALNRFNAPFYEAIATTGIGVHDTLKAVSKLVLRALSRKAKEDQTDGDETVASSAPTPPPSPEPGPAPPAAPESGEPAPVAAGWSEDALASQLEQMNAAEIEGLLQEVEEFDTEGDPGIGSASVAPTGEQANLLDPVQSASGTDGTESFTLDEEPGYGIPSLDDLDLGAIPDGEPAPEADAGAAGVSTDDLFSTAVTDVAASEPDTETETVLVDEFDPADGEDAGGAPAEASGLSFESFLAADEATEDGFPAAPPSPPTRSVKAEIDPTAGEAQMHTVQLNDTGELHLAVCFEVNGHPVRYTLTLRLRPGSPSGS